MAPNQDDSIKMEPKPLANTDSSVTPESLPDHFTAHPADPASPLESQVTAPQGITQQGTARSGRPLSWQKKCLFASICTIWFLLVVEIGLRLAGFRYPDRPIDIVVGGRVVAPMLRASDRMGWEPLPNQNGFNAAGFLGPMLPKTRQLEVFRIATLGDSCTHWGEPPYPAVLQEKLSQKLALPVEVLNAGVTGFSSEQGLRRLDQVLAYRPDVITIYFGWNDHVTTSLRPDHLRLPPRRPAQSTPHGNNSQAETLASEAMSTTSRVSWVWRTSRVAQGVWLCWDAFLDWSTPRFWLRVPKERFAANLREMVQRIRLAQAQPILIVPPSNLLPETEVEELGQNYRYLQEAGFTSPLALHEAYVSVVREVGREQQVPVLDAAALMDRQAAWFLADRVHLTPAGIEQMAELLANFLEPYLRSVPEPNSTNASPN